jgi:hypothetical protein
VITLITAKASAQHYIKDETLGAPDSVSVGTLRGCNKKEWLKG